MLDDCAQSDAGALVPDRRRADVFRPASTCSGSERRRAYVRTFLPSLDRMLETLFLLFEAGRGGRERARDRRRLRDGVGRGLPHDGARAGRIGIRSLLVGSRSRSSRSRSCASPRRADLQAMAYRGLTLTAESALQHGLVDAVVGCRRLLDEAVAVAESLAALPSAAFLLTKTQMRAPTRRRMRAGAASTPPCRTRGVHPKRWTRSASTSRGR